MKKTKKILSLVLAIIMIVCTIPMVHADETTFKVGDIIQFGSYPQSEVKDEALISELNALAPEWEDWTSYGYYSYDNHKKVTVQGDWMRYYDVVYMNSMYRCVKFLQYRPYDTLEECAEIYSFQDGNDYYTNSIYWFKFEPINWRILNPDTGLVICETILDSQSYNNIYYNSKADDLRYAYFSEASFINYANDYENSEIRKWLNEDFYNTAFSDNEKKAIVVTTLNNDGYYTSNNINGYEKLDSSTTKDRIFLVSYDDIKNSDYGFASNDRELDPSKVAYSSDYSKCQGLYVYRERNNDSPYEMMSHWWLRTAGEESNIVCYVSIGGMVSATAGIVSSTNVGIRPALCLSSIYNVNHKHKYTTIKAQPTCTEKGYTTYICECTDSYIDDYADALGHDMSILTTTKEATCTATGKERVDCSRCDYFETNTITVLNHSDFDYDGYCDECKEFIADKNCDCYCHGKDFWKFLYNILLAIQKLIKVDLLRKVLKLGKICACGIAHY